MYRNTTQATSPPKIQPAGRCGNIKSVDKLRQPRSVVYSAEQVLQFYSTLYRICCKTVLCTDHVTELRNARGRVRDLEAAASSQRAEVGTFINRLFIMLMCSCVCQRCVSYLYLIAKDFKPNNQ